MLFFFNIRGSLLRFFYHKYTRFLCKPGYTRHRNDANIQVKSTILLNKLSKTASISSLR